MIDKEKLLARINDHMKCGEESIELLVKGRNYAVAETMKATVDYLKILKFDIQQGCFDADK